MTPANKLSYIFLLAALLLLPGLTPSSTGAQSVEELRREKRQAEQRKERIQSRLREIKDNQRELSSVVRRLDRQLNSLRTEITKLASEISQLGKERNKLKQELKQLRQRHDRVVDQLNSRALSIYMSSEFSALELILKSGSLEQLTQSLFYLEVMVDRDQQLVNRVETTKNALETKKARLDQKYMKLRETKAELERKKEEKREQLSVKRELKQAVDHDRVLWERKMAALKQESKRIEEELKEVIRQNGGYAGEWSGSFLKPVNARISSEFGRRRHPIHGTVRMHEGIDFAAGRGARVRAAGAGKVVFAGYRNGYGYTVIISHGVDSAGRNVQTLYAHNSRLLVNKGETVNRGETVARVGSTGISTGPHAHFEVRLNGAPVDPLNYDM